ncbi:MAG: carbon-nitrogen hydrolase family protein [Candidatus Omnitrophica bacterium]|nr:carbon-nitrogen hydrolase family protein [Candidatus Omnitrophota bacterium]
MSNMKDNRIRVGMGQLLVEGGEPERNLERACKMIALAKERECDIVLLPENLDLAWTHPSAKTEAQPIPGPFSDILCREAIRHSLYICAGLTEKEKDTVYDSAILIDAKGSIILKYHKINTLAVEQEFYAVGNSLSVVNTPFGKIGVNICADNYMDGLAIGHVLGRMGAQVILSPSSWTVSYAVTEKDDPYGEKWLKPYSLLAKMFNLVVIGTTSVGVIVGGPYEGKKMIGCSLAVGPQGIIARGRFNEFAGELIVAEFEVPRNQAKGTLIGDKIKEQNDLAKKDPIEILKF